MRERGRAGDCAARFVVAYVLDLPAGGWVNARGGAARSAPKATELLHRREMTRNANSDIGPSYSIISSARADSAPGPSNPSAIAVLMLITNSKLATCTTGRSEGLSPLRIRPA